MAENKDPAVLFYTNDFISGTYLMSYEQRGKYITLLCLQHQQGHLTEDDMLSICGQYDKRIFDKFSKDENGLYYNSRMDAEKEKRSNFVKSKHENGSKGGRPKKPKENLTETDRFCLGKPNENLPENVNENKNININNNETDINNKQVKHKYGEFNNVLLTDDEYEKLKEKYPFNYQKRIDDLSIYISSKGDKYKSHYHTILAWDRRNNEGNENLTFDADDFFEAALKRSYEGED